jgi:KAP family P-loop domain
LRNIDKSILIFDDLERCKVEISSLLGYINYFVEQQEMKVIIIANESVILNTNLR